MGTNLNTKSFNTPDESRTPPKTRVDVVDLGTNSAARVTFDAGWKWSEVIKPVVGTDSCQARHVGVLVSGQMHVVHDDGSEMDIAAGSAYIIEPGHDAWTVGDEGAVGYEFESKTAETFAKA